MPRRTIVITGASDGIAAVAFHPGVLASNFASDTTHPMRWAYHTPLVRRTFTITPARSAQRLLWLVNGRPGETWQPGEYYEGRRIARSHPVAADPAVATGLWEASDQLLVERGLI